MGWWWWQIERPPTHVGLRSHGNDLSYGREEEGELPKRNIISEMRRSGQRCWVTKKYYFRGFGSGAAIYDWYLWVEIWVRVKDVPFFPNLQFLTMLETAGFVKRLEVIVLETGFCKWDPNWLVPPAVLWHSHQHAYIKGSKGTPKTIFGHFFIIMNKMIQIFTFLSLSSLIVLLMIRSGVATVERQVTFLIFPLLKKSLQLILLPLMKHTWYLSFLVLYRII